MGFFPLRPEAVFESQCDHGTLAQKLHDTIGACHQAMFSGYGQPSPPPREENTHTVSGQQVVGTGKLIIIHTDVTGECWSQEAMAAPDEGQWGQ